MKTQSFLSQKLENKGFVDNKKYLKKIVEKNLKNMLTMKYTFGMITKSLTTKASDKQTQNLDK